MDTGIIVLLATLALGAAASAEDTDSTTTLLTDSAVEAAPSTKPDPPRRDDPLATDTAPRPAQAPNAIGAADHGAARADDRAGGDWTVLVDFADVDGGMRVNRRHMRSDSLVSLCCLDAAWTPLRPTPRIAMGVSTNLGYWTQDLPGGLAVAVSDILVASSLLWRRDGSGPWARADLGVSTLVVDRVTVGVDWGVGGAVRVGWRWERDPVSWIAGLGWDFRRYVHLDMKDVPAITLSAGVEW